MIDDLQGERVDVETASDAKLAEMDADYARYTDDSWGKAHGDWMRSQWDEVKAEIAHRKEVIT